jgi:hypothetical protein
MVAVDLSAATTICKQRINGGGLVTSLADFTKALIVTAGMTFVNYIQIGKMLSCN